MMILFFNYTVQYFDFTEKRRKPSASPSITKKRASISSNKENVIEIIDLESGWKSTSWSTKKNEWFGAGYVKYPKAKKWWTWKGNHVIRKKKSNFRLRSFIMFFFFIKW